MPRRPGIRRNEADTPVYRAKKDSECPKCHRGVMKKKDGYYKCNQCGWEIK